MITQSNYQPILVVDVAGFSSRPAPVQSRVRVNLYRLLAESLKSAGISADDIADRGDGALVILPVGTNPALLVSTAVDTLADLLTTYNSTAGVDERIVVRMAMHAGHVHHDDRGYTGQAVILPFRLIDAKPLRRILLRSGQALAVCVSDEIYRGVIRDQALTPQAYQQVRVRNKEVRAVAWVRVPGRRPPFAGARGSLASIVAAVAAVVVLGSAGVAAAVAAQGDRNQQPRSAGPSGTPAAATSLSATAAPTGAARSSATTRSPLTFTPGPTSQLVVIHSGKCAFPGPGSRVIQQKCPPLTDRQWEVQLATNAGTADLMVRILERGTARCLTAVAPGPVAGAVQVVIRECATAATLDQVWRFHITARDKGWTYGRLMNQQREVDQAADSCLDVNGGHTGDGAVLVTWQCTGAGNQLFRIVM